MIGMAHCQLSTLTQAIIACDPYWNQVTTLLNFEGANGSTAFIDSAGKANWGNEFVNANGRYVPGTYLSTTSPILGSSSVDFRKSNVNEGNYAISRNPDASCPPNVPLTIELAYRPFSLPFLGGTINDQKHVLFSKSNTSSNGSQDVILYIDYNLRLGFKIGTSRPNPITLESPSQSISVGNTCFIKITIDGVNIKLYVNDTEVASSAYSHYFPSGGTLIIGQNYAYHTDNTRCQSDGKFDAVRITTAIRPSGFGVVPTQSYPSIACTN